LTLTATGKVELVGKTLDSPISFTSLSTYAETDSTGNAGELTVNTQDLLVRDGAQVFTSTFSAGKSGNLTINATDKVELIGTSVNGRLPSALASSAEPGSTGNAGDLTIKTQNLLVRDGAQVLTETFAAGQGGNLTVNADRSIQLIGTSADGGIFSGLSTSANLNSSKNAGDLIINTRDLLIRDGAQVTTRTFGGGKGGSLNVTGTDKVELIGTSKDGRFFSSLASSAEPGSTGNAGDLTVNTQNLLMRDGARVFTDTFGAGEGGNLTVNADRSIQLIGTSADGDILSGLSAAAQTGSNGNAGDLTVNTQDLLVQDGARVITGTFGAGKAGNLTVNASRQVELIGTSTTDNNLVSGLLASSYEASTGDAGNIAVDTQNLLVRDGAQVFNGTFGAGKAGNLTVNASRQVELIGRSTDGRFPSGLLVSTEPNSTGNAGDIKVDTPLLLVRNGAEVLANARGTGNAGIMTINAERIRLDNKASINANTRNLNKDPNREQATINIRTQDLSLRRDSNISTNATGENVIGGNINIDTDLLIALENSRISANSDNSRGGRVRINAQGIFVGTKPSDVSKYITATSGVGLSGTVNVNSPDNSSLQNSLTEFPQNFIDSSTLIANSCISRGNKPQEGSFIITGSSALPNHLGDVSASNYATGNVRGLADKNTSHSWKKGDPIVEPTGVYKLADGRLIMSRKCW
jgi:large exoprotein involved in heme utilization and adhesion